MKFTDTKAEYNLFKKEIDKELGKVIASGQYLFGKQMARLEERIAAMSGKSDAVAVGSGIDALILAIRSVWHRDMPVIIPNFGAYPTAIAVRNITSNIHFVDVDDTLTIDVNKLPGDVKNGIIIPVSLFGNSFHWAIMDYSNSNNHIIIGDYAQALPTTMDISYISCFSFYPTNPIASMGDGGMICTDNTGRADYIRSLRFYGQHKGKVEHIGINSRMDEMQCAVVNAKIYNRSKHDEMTTHKRRRIAYRYKNIIKGIRETRGSCCYHQFPVLFEKRDEVIIPALKKRGIPFMIHYPCHISEMPAFADIKSEVGFRVAQKIISLPVHPFLTESEIQQVEEFLNDHKKLEWNPVKK